LVKKHPCIAGVKVKEEAISIFYEQKQSQKIEPQSTYKREFNN
jgi:hypothetical protein